LSPAKTESTLGGYYATESSQHNSANGVNKTQLTVLRAQKQQNFWNLSAKILHELLGTHIVDESNTASHFYFIFNKKNEPPLFATVFVVYSHYYMFRPT
jgi:hypothetical protein